MRVLTAEQIAGNAYRLLGLPATASQADVEQAARRMRIWPDGKRIPPTAWDLPWVGALTRSKGAVEQAVARLMDPESRVTERLAWFHTSAPAAGPEAGEEFDRAVEGMAGSEQSAAQHGAALARYVAASVRDPEVADLARWRSCVESVQALAESGAFRDYLIELEAGGDFEKRAAMDEVTASLAVLPGAVIAGLMGRAESALEDDKLEPALNVAKLLRSTDAAACGRLLDRVEDVVERRCATAAEELRRTVVFRDDMVASNEQACRQAQKYYEESIQPVVGALGTFAAEEPHRTERVRWACARLLSDLGTAWIAARYFAAADRTFRAGKELAKGSTLERRLDAQIDENAPRLRQYQASYHVMDVGPSAITTPAEARETSASTDDIHRPAVPRPKVEYARPRSFQMSTTPPRPVGGGFTSTFAGGTFLVFVIMGVIRAIVSGLGPSTPSRSTYYVPPAPSYNYTPPRTTPYTDPSSQDVYRSLRDLNRNYSPPVRTPEAEPTFTGRPTDPSPTNVTPTPTLTLTPPQFQPLPRAPDQRQIETQTPAQTPTPPPPSTPNEAQVSAPTPAPSAPLAPTTPDPDPSNRDAYQALRNLTGASSEAGRTPGATIRALPPRPAEPPSPAVPPPGKASAQPPAQTSGQPTGQPSAPSIFFDSQNDLTLTPKYSALRSDTESKNDRGRSK